MKAEIKKHWIAALRSGKYQQGEGANKANTPQEFRAVGMYVDKTPTQRLRAILTNLLANDGVFKVPSK